MLLGLMAVAFALAPGPLQRRARAVHRPDDIVADRFTPGQEQGTAYQVVGDIHVVDLLDAADAPAVRVLSPHRVVIDAHAIDPGQLDARWIYAARTIAVGALLVFLWWRFDELHTSARMGVADWVLATVSGALIFVVWIHLDEGWVVIGDPSAHAFDPRQYGEETLHIPLTALRLIGLAIVAVGVLAAIIAAAISEKSDR